MINALKDINITKQPVSVWVEELFKKVSINSVNHRSINVSNAQLLKKTNKLNASLRSEASLFSEILFLKRKQLRHVGIYPIKPGSREWLELKEIAHLASEFCHEFDLKIKEGYREYIDIALNRMGKKYFLNRFKSYHQVIVNEYEAKMILVQDPTPQQTKAIHDEYISIIASRIGFSQSYYDTPEKYKCFVDVKNVCRMHGIDPKVYLDAQFAALEFVNGVPSPENLVGVKGMERLQKYLYENGIKLGNKVKVVDFNKIKKR